MSEATTQGQSATDQAGSGSVAPGWRARSLIAIVLTLCTTPVAFVAIRWLWAGWKQRVLYGDVIDLQSLQIVATTPFTVLVVELALATGVGLLLALEWLAYSARRQLLPAGWWVGGPLSRGTRWVLALLALALFPVGVALGYTFVAPPVALAVEALGATVSVVQMSMLLALATVATGVAVQAVYVSGVLVLCRLWPVTDANSAGD